MKIITYQSANAPTNMSWIAYIVREPSRKAKTKLDHGETNDPMGFLPIRFSGHTEEDVSKKAVEWWRNGEETRAQKLEARKAAAIKRAAKATS